MKKIVVLLFALVTLQANAQKLIGGDHIIKTNLSADALQNYNLTFEKSLNHFMSLSISYSSMPKRSIPLKSLAKKYINNPNIDFDNFKVANNALTFEGRFYLGLQKMSGLYIAPYARFGNLEANIPINYKYDIQVANQTVTVTPPPANLSGTIRSQSFGAYFGMQFQLLTKVVLDFWVIGGHYGTSNGKLQFDAPTGTPPQALTALKSTIDQTKVHPFNIKTSISGNSVITDTEGPWAGIRGAGLTVGVRF
jgi:hypothetical protein